jgi:hypothetical protein
MRLRRWACNWRPSERRLQAATTFSSAKLNGLAFGPAPPPVNERVVVAAPAVLDHKPGDRQVAHRGVGRREHDDLGVVDVVGLVDEVEVDVHWLPRRLSSQP